MSSASSASDEMLAVPVTSSPSRAARRLEALGVAAADRRLVEHHRRTPQAALDHARREHRRLLFERADLVVEHPLRSGALAARVVDRRDARRVAERRDDQRVVGDRRADDRDHALVVELGERALDVVLRSPTAARAPGRSTNSNSRSRRPGRRDLVEPEPQRRRRTGRRPAGSRRAIRSGSEARRWPCAGTYAVSVLVVLRDEVGRIAGDVDPRRVERGSRAFGAIGPRHRRAREVRARSATGA